jgi:hypothetical protein
MATSFSGGRVPERTSDHVQATGRLYDLQIRVECILLVIYKAVAYIFQNRIDGVMLRASSIVDRGFEPRSGQTNDYMHLC